VLSQAEVFEQVPGSLGVFRLEVFDGEAQSWGLPVVVYLVKMCLRSVTSALREAFHHGMFFRGLVLVPIVEWRALLIWFVQSFQALSGSGCLALSCVSASGHSSACGEEVGELE